MSRRERRRVGLQVEMASHVQRKSSLFVLVLAGACAAVVGFNCSKSEESLKHGLQHAAEGDLDAALAHFVLSLGGNAASIPRGPGLRTAPGCLDFEPEAPAALGRAGNISATVIAQALHSVGNIHVLRAQFKAAVDCHRRAKLIDPASVPPLAFVCQPAEEGIPSRCGSALSDLLFSSSVVKQTLYQKTPVETRPQPSASGVSAPLQLNAVELVQMHCDLAMQLDAAGCDNETVLHLSRAAELERTVSMDGQPSLRIQLRAALTVPMLYQSIEHVRRQREQVVRAVHKVFLRVHARHGETNEALDSFTMPSTFRLVYMGLNDAQIMNRVCAIMRQRYPALDYTSEHIAAEHASTKIVGAHAQAVQRRSLRVGFVSAHWREHSVCKLLCAVVRGLAERKGGEFEVLLLSTSRRKDAWTSYALGETPHPYTANGRGTDGGPPAVAAHTTELVHLPNGALEATRIIAGLRLDALVFADLGMELTAFMWAFTRMAPVQAQFWGHPVTSGTGAIDYFVSSEQHWGVPAATSLRSSLGNASRQSNASARDALDAQLRFNEQLVRFESGSFAFHRPPRVAESAVATMRVRLAAVVDAVNTLEAQGSDGIGGTGARPWLERELLQRASSQGGGRAASNIINGPIIVVPQAVMKFHPLFDEALLLILRKLELNASNKGVVIVVDHAGTPVHRHALRSRLRDALVVDRSDESHIDNVGGAVALRQRRTLAQRIVLLPKLGRAEFAALLRLACVALDPYPFGGGVTTLETLAEGTPVVTYPGGQNVPQLAAGMIRHVDGHIHVRGRLMPLQAVLVADNVTHYAAQAVALATDRALQIAVREAIERRSHVLFEHEAVVSEWARFLHGTVKSARGS